MSSASSKPYQLKSLDNTLKYSNSNSLSSPFYSAKKLTISYFIELIIGIFCTISAIHWNRLQCSWFCYQTNKEFSAICVYVFLYPFGFMLLIDSMTKIAASKSTHIVLKSIIFIIMGFTCILIPAYLFLPNQWNGFQYFKLYEIPPRSHYMNIYILSFQLFILWIPIGFTFLAIAYRLFKNEKRKLQNMGLTPPTKMNMHRSKDKPIKKSILDADMNVSESMQSKSMSSSLGSGLLPTLIGQKSLLIQLKSFQCTKQCINIFIFIFIIIPLMWLSTTLLPAGYDKFRLPVDTRDEMWIITEPSPSNWTINWHIHSIYLHIYIDVFIYYIGILLTLFIGYASQQWRKSRKKLRRFAFVYRLRLCKNEWILSLYIGQCILLLIWITILIIIFIYFNWIHKFQNDKLDQKLKPYNGEKFIRTCGIMATIFCGMCLIPVTRGTKILSICFGISFESGIKYHRILGLLMIIFAVIHFIGFIILLIKNNYYSVIHIFSKQMPFDNKSIYHGDNWTILLMQVIILFIFIPFCIVVLFPKIRRKFWELFYFIHIYGTMVIVIGIMYHSSQAWYFMFPGLLLQFYDRLWRLYNCSRSNIRIISFKQIANDIIRLRINIANHHPTTQLCSYYFINMPHINPLEWHPFSVNNTLNNEYTEFYIKTIGNYSSKLLKLTYQINQQCFKNMDILVEGPFGCDIDYHSYHRLVLIAGGIGITPLHNLFFTLYNQALSNTRNIHNNDKMYIGQLPSINLIWIVRYADMFEIYKKSFNRYKRFNAELPNMNITLYATREEVRYPATMHDVSYKSFVNVNCINEEDESDYDDMDMNHKENKLSMTINSQSSLKFGLHSSMSSLENKQKNNKKKKKKGIKNKSGMNRNGIRNVECPIKWKIGRPDLFQELRYLDQLKSKAVVYACGPPELVKTCQELAHLYGNHFKKETFLF